MTNKTPANPEDDNEIKPGYWFWMNRRLYRVQDLYYSPTSPDCIDFKWECVDLYGNVLYISQSDIKRCEKAEEYIFKNPQGIKKGQWFRCAGRTYVTVCGGAWDAFGCPGWLCTDISGKSHIFPEAIIIHSEGA